MDSSAQTLDTLRSFRNSLYRCFDRRADALFELTDAPVDARRVEPTENADEVAAEQVRTLAQRLPEPEAVPICVFDAGYEPVKLQRALERCPAQILLRLHSNRVFYAAP